MKPRKEVEEMKPYNPPLEGRREYIRLDFNENTLGPSPKVLEAIKNSSSVDICSYPEYDKLIGKLSDYLGIGTDQLVITNASDEGIKLVFETYLEKGDSIILPVPTFTMFEFYAELMGIKVNKILYNKDLSFPTSQVLLAEGKLVVLVNPNNPTGTSIKKEDIIEVLEEGKIVLLDEAYFQFSGETCKDFIDKYDNLIILQTFSKAFGMAGLRLGYILTQDNSYLKKAQSPYSVNNLAVIGALAALDDVDYVSEYVSRIKVGKKVLIDGLKAKGITVIDSKANFVLVKVDDPSDFVDRLRSNKVLVRDRSSEPLLEGCVRITIGTKEQMEKVLEVI